MKIIWRVFDALIGVKYFMRYGLNWIPGYENVLMFDSSCEYVELSTQSKDSILFLIFSFFSG